MHQRETDEDGAMLRAVRAFLMDDDAFQGLDSDDDAAPRVVPLYIIPEDSSSSTDSSGIVTQPLTEPVRVTSSAPPIRPRVVNRSRTRRRKEIASLREQSIALERRVLELRQTGDDKAPCIRDSKAQHQSTPHQYHGWHAAALTQRKRVKAAELEREKLRKTISNYKGMVRRVRRAVRNHIQKHEQLVPLIQPRSPRRTTPTLQDAAAFQDLSNHLEAMVSQVDALFPDRRDGVDNLTEQLQDLRIHHDDTPDMSFQVGESRLLPFDVAATARAAWFVVSAKMSEIVVHQDEHAMDSENVLRRSFVSALSYPNYTGTTRGRVEARRYFDQERVIILRCATFDRMDPSKGDGTDGYGIRVLNWTVIGPPRDERLRSLSRVDIFEVMMPFFPEGTTETAHDRKALKVFCVETIKFVHTFERQAVENILLGGSQITQDAAS